MSSAVAENVQRLLKARGWTVYRLAKESGVSLTALYNLGKHTSGPTASTLVKIAKTLDVTVDELLQGGEVDG
ncbi:MAG: helix-turn-helix domain-containing protein [Alicyclobacillus macrosporangiidus]|uniref:helix-turn-helix domain-containing protein n=1 Tax=Alicyclobacillus macrosporangiidus TaxID=392015 RepID=UPI0026F0EA36|nr:helix-turn-helix transcriptional regulator [Alicyclobacillus macrosporangiidus]MCL6598960.1 helix-turn-helix domain-containing protein [Alicyclobacillus macrosporangiidus]